MHIKKGVLHRFLGFDFREKNRIRWICLSILRIVL